MLGASAVQQSAARLTRSRWRWRQLQGHHRAHRQEFTGASHSVVISSAATGVLYPDHPRCTFDLATWRPLSKAGVGRQGPASPMPSRSLGLGEGGQLPGRGHLAPLAGELAIANPRQRPGAAAMATPGSSARSIPAVSGADWHQHQPDLAVRRYRQCEAGLRRLANLVEAGKTGGAWAVPASFIPHRAVGPGAEERAAVDALVAWPGGAGTGSIVRKAGLRPAAAVSARASAGLAAPCWLIRSMSQGGATGCEAPCFIDTERDPARKGTCWSADLRVPHHCHPAALLPPPLAWSGCPVP